MDAFRVERTIGKGSYGSALLATELQSNRKFVVKAVDMSRMDADARRRALSEVNVLRVIRHPFVIGYHRSFICDSTLHIVLDYAAGGDLGARVKAAKCSGVPFPESQIVRWFTQMVIGLQCIHAHKVLHRDVKPQNIFLSRDGDVKIGDFGISKTLDSTLDLADTWIGTPYHCSPELCMKQRYNFKTDMWSLGVVLYELLTLKHPFQASSLITLIHNIMVSDPPPIENAYSDGIKSIATALLQKDPSKRPSATEVLQLPFMREHARRARVHAHSASQRHAPSTLRLNIVPRTSHGLQAPPRPTGGDALSAAGGMPSLLAPPTPPVVDGHSHGSAAATAAAGRPWTEGDAGSGGGEALQDTLGMPAHLSSPLTEDGTAQTLGGRDATSYDPGGGAGEGVPLSLAPLTHASPPSRFASVPLLRPPPAHVAVPDLATLASGGNGGGGSGPSDDAATRDDFPSPSRTHSAPLASDVGAGERRRAFSDPVAPFSSAAKFDSPPHGAARGTDTAHARLEVVARRDVASWALGGTGSGASATSSIGAGTSDCRNATRSPGDIGSEVGGRADVHDDGRHSAGVEGGTAGPPSSTPMSYVSLDDILLAAGIALPLSALANGASPGATATFDALQSLTEHASAPLAGRPGRPLLGTALTRQLSDASATSVGGPAVYLRITPSDVLDDDAFWDDVDVAFEEDMRAAGSDSGSRTRPPAWSQVLSGGGAPPSSRVTSAQRPTPLPPLPMPKAGSVACTASQQRARRQVEAAAVTAVRSAMAELAADAALSFSVSPLDSTGASTPPVQPVLVYSAPASDPRTCGVDEAASSSDLARLAASSPHGSAVAQHNATQHTPTHTQAPASNVWTLSSLAEVALDEL